MANDFCFARWLIWIRWKWNQHSRGTGTYHFDVNFVVQWQEPIAEYALISEQKKNQSNLFFFQKYISFCLRCFPHFSIQYNFLYAGELSSVCQMHENKNWQLRIALLSVLNCNYAEFSSFFGLQVIVTFYCCLHSQQIVHRSELCNLRGKISRKEWHDDMYSIEFLLRNAVHAAWNESNVIKKFLFDFDSRLLKKKPLAIRSK